jgi:hypothetical protein
MTALAVATLSLAGCAELGLPLGQDTVNAPQVNSRAASRSPVPVPEQTERRTRAAPTTAPANCVTPEVLAQSLALLPDAERAALRQTLDQGTALANQRALWRTEVKQAELDSTRLRMPAPGFGCNNPGLGAATALPGRSNQSSLWANSDCMADAKTDSGRGLPATSPAIQQARNAVTAQITRLKSEDPELARREQDLALALAQHLQSAVQHWSRVPAASFGLQELASMETFGTQVVGQCTARQGRATSDSEAQVKQATANLVPVFDSVLASRSGAAAAELSQATSRATLQAGMRRLFPTPLLEQRARLQAPIVAALDREGARVAALDARAERDKKAKLAALNKKLWEQSPEFLARKRNLENAATNAAPTSDEVRNLVIDYLIADRQGSSSPYAAERRNGNQMRFTITMPVVGTMQTYLAEVNLDSLRCKPVARKQMCDLEYSERTLDGANSVFSPTGDVNRKHHAEFSWSEEGLQSAGLKVAIVSAHKAWHDRVNAILEKRAAIHRAWSECKDRLGFNASDKTVSRICGWEP